MRSNISHVVVLCFVVVGQQAVAQTGTFVRLRPERLLRVEDVDRACKRGQELVVEFYRCLLSGRPATELPNIFGEGRAYGAAESAKIWEEVLANKDVFLLDAHTRLAPVAEWGIHDLGKVAIVFEDTRKGGEFWESYLFIDIMGFPATALHTNGTPMVPMMKQVRFGIGRVGDDYRIDPWKIYVGAVFWVPMQLPKEVRVACPQNIRDALGLRSERFWEVPLDTRGAENPKR